MSLIKITQNKTKDENQRNVLFPLDNRHFITDSKFLDCSYDHGLISTFNKVKNKASNLNVGDSVRVKAGSKWYDGQSIANCVFKNQYEVIQIKGDRVVIGVNGKVTGAISLDSLY